jgi:glycosyltransferase involved in cell wall biosynthesis
MVSPPVRVSIGVPVYNGENYLAAALDSLLAQTFTDFEIIISDNASSDRTEEICQAYAARDARIRYHRQPQNVGLAPNFNGLMEMARGEYFKWAAHDDLCAPEFLERCVTVLDNQPDMIAVYPWTQVIDEQGHPVSERYEFNGKLRPSSDKPHERFFDIVCTFQMCYSMFGVFRKSALLKTPLHGSYGHSDGVLLARLALLGKSYEIPEFLFFSRRHAEQSTMIHMQKDGNQDYARISQWFNTQRKKPVQLPYWTLLSEYSRAIAQSPIPLSEKIICFNCLRTWLRTYWTHLVRDLPGVPQSKPKSRTQIA